MPCRYDPTPDEIAAAKKAAKEKDDKIARAQKDLVSGLKNKLDTVTRLLCGVMTNVEVEFDFPGPDGLISDELHEWWKAHKEVDKKRLAEEARVKQAEKKKLQGRAKELQDELAKINKRLGK